MAGMTFSRYLSGGRYLSGSRHLSGGRRFTMPRARWVIMAFVRVGGDCSGLPH